MRKRSVFTCIPHFVLRVLCGGSTEQHLYDVPATLSSLHGGFNGHGILGLTLNHVSATRYPIDPIKLHLLSPDIVIAPIPPEGCAPGTVCETTPLDAAAPPPPQFTT